MEIYNDVRWLGQKMACDGAHIDTHPHHTQPTTWELQHKADASPLTKADLEANALICRRLKQLGMLM